MLDALAAQCLTSPFGDKASMRTRTRQLWLVCAVSVMVSLARQTGGNAESAQPLIEMDNVPLSGAISNLARAANLNYVIDPRASSASIGPSKWLMPETSVTCRRTDLTPEQALDYLLKRHNLRTVTNTTTSVARIVPAAQFAEPVAASEIENDTNAVIPVVHLENVPLTVVISELGKKAQLKISVNPDLPIPSSGPPQLTVATSIASLHWENIRPGQALAALLDTCDLSLVEEPGTRSAIIKSKQSGAKKVRERGQEGAL